MRHAVLWVVAAAFLLGPVSLPIRPMVLRMARLAGFFAIFGIGLGAGVTIGYSSIMSVWWSRRIWRAGSRDRGLSRRVTWFQRRLGR